MIVVIVVVLEQCYLSFMANHLCAFIHALFPLTDFTSQGFFHLFDVKKYLLSILHER